MSMTARECDEQLRGAVERASMALMDHKVTCLRCRRQFNAAPRCGAGQELLSEERRAINHLSNFRNELARIRELQAKLQSPRLVEAETAPGAFAASYRQIEGEIELLADKWGLDQEEL